MSPDAAHRYPRTNSSWIAGFLFLSFAGATGNCCVLFSQRCNQPRGHCPAFMNVRLSISLPTKLGTISLVDFSAARAGHQPPRRCHCLFPHFPFVKESCERSGPKGRTHPHRRTKSFALTTATKLRYQYGVRGAVVLIFLAKRLQKAFSVDRRGRHCCCVKSATMSWEIRRSYPNPRSTPSLSSIECTTSRSAAGGVKSARRGPTEPLS